MSYNLTRQIMHQRDKKPKRPASDSSPDDVEKFDEAMNSYLNENFLEDDEDSKKSFEELKYSKATYSLIIRTLIIKGHIDIIEEALEEEEEGINQEDEQHIKYVEALRGGYPE